MSCKLHFLSSLLSHGFHRSLLQRTQTPCSSSMRWRSTRHLKKFLMQRLISKRSFPFTGITFRLIEGYSVLRCSDGDYSALHCRFLSKSCALFPVKAARAEECRLAFIVSCDCLEESFEGGLGRGPGGRPGSRCHAGKCLKSTILDGDLACCFLSILIIHPELGHDSEWVTEHQRY